MFLVINAGSSSLKLEIFKTENDSIKGFVNWDDKRPKLILTHKKKTILSKLLNPNNKEKSVDEIFHHLKEIYPKIQKIAHRVVHGGEYKKPMKITPSVKSKIQKLSKLAPLHNPIELECIQRAEKIFGKIKQYACFDTAFFHSLPKIHQMYPLPAPLYNRGIKRYGFHGISHESMNKRLNKTKKKQRVVTCHLGGGCSLSASYGGICVDTTMGFTPLDGVMMGTRPGAIDPGILLHLIKNEKYSTKKLEEMLYHESGLMGICGTEDMRQILNSRTENSKLALALFVNSIAKGIYTMICSLKGCDIIAFSGGIGEQSHQIRQKILEALEPFGVELDPKTNKKTKMDQIISCKSSSVAVWVLKANEEKAIYLKCKNL